MSAEPKILVVEDDDFYRGVLVSILSGMEVQTAKNSAEALQSFKLHKPDMVFLDINLPDKSGHDVLEQLLAENPKVFVVMATGSSEQKDVMQAVKTGAKGYLVKPYAKLDIDRYIKQYKSEVVTQE